MGTGVVGLSEGPFGAAEDDGAQRGDNAGVSERFGSGEPGTVELTSPRFCQWEDENDEEARDSDDEADG